MGSAPAATSQPTHQNLDPFPPRVATADEEEEEHEAPDGLIKEATGNKKQPKRSIALSGLAADTTLPQIAEVVRGGTILDMFLRPGTKSAQVSFVDPAAAEAFLAHAQKRVIHIGGNKVRPEAQKGARETVITNCEVQITVAWAGKQTVFRDYQIRRITTYGATRNVVVRNAPPGMTEASIRGDLEHIHRLEVVEVKFDKDHIFISLNNVLLAITARQCMYSRERYQRMKLEFYLDECAGPLLPVPVPTVAGMQPLPKPVAVKPAQIPVRNRFELLDDDAEDE